jgi:ketosteroid isomerase-like protein
MQFIPLASLRISLCAIGMSCLAISAHAADVKSTIEANNVKFGMAAAKGDGAALAAMYVADGQVMPAGSDPIKGKEAIQKFWQGALDSGVAGVKLTTVEVFAQGSKATEVGQYQLLDKSSKELDHGKYIVVWQLEGGKWMLLRDMFSTNVAPKK